MKKFIAVAGNMGVGKSSMVEFLSAQYGFDPIYEPYIDNPYLDDFYADMSRWGFHSQLHFLTNKFRLHMALNTHANTVVQDRTIYEDAEIFCTNLYKARHIKKRGRKSELDIPTNYLRRLNSLYEDWIDRYEESPVLVWDSERLDYLTDLVDRIEFKRNIEKFL